MDSSPKARLGSCPKEWGKARININTCQLSQWKAGEETACVGASFIPPLEKWGEGEDKANTLHSLPCKEKGRDAHVPQT